MRRLLLQPPLPVPWDAQTAPHLFLWDRRYIPQRKSCPSSGLQCRNSLVHPFGPYRLYTANHPSVPPLFRQAAQYPFITWGPLTASSPTWPAGSGSPVSISTTAASVLGNGIPTLPRFESPNMGLQWVVGEASDSP